jgi:hypothetical protein
VPRYVRLNIGTVPSLTSWEILYLVLLCNYEKLYYLYKIKNYMENNLIKTGQWYWREDEISLKNFYKLPKEEKEAHIKFILSLDISQRSTNDQYILVQEKVKEEESNFFSL